MAKAKGGPILERYARKDSKRLTGPEILRIRFFKEPQVLRALSYHLSSWYWPEPFQHRCSVRNKGGHNVSIRDPFRRYR